MTYKWHYFNSADDICRYVTKPFSIQAEVTFFTACNKDIEKVKRHSEFKSRVDCIQCIKRLNFKLKKGD